MTNATYRRLSVSAQIDVEEIVTEPAQLALDPDHAPPGVLPRQAHDQRNKLVGYGRAARRPGLERTEGWVTGLRLAALSAG
jgi:hypothetical protein